MALELTQPPVQWIPAVNSTLRETDHPTTSAKAKNECGNNIDNQLDATITVYY